MVFSEGVISPESELSRGRERVEWLMLLRLGIQLFELYIIGVNFKDCLLFAKFMEIYYF